MGPSPRGFQRRHVRRQPDVLGDQRLHDHGLRRSGRPRVVPGRTPDRVHRRRTRQRPSAVRDERGRIRRASAHREDIGRVLYRVAADRGGNVANLDPARRAASDAVVCPLRVRGCNDGRRRVARFVRARPSG